MITELVPCGNPNIKKLVDVRNRHVAIFNNFEHDTRDGVKYCAWCWVKPFKHPRIKYCSDECRESCNLFCYPQTEAGLQFLMISRGPNCESCGYSYAGVINTVRAERISQLNQFFENAIRYQSRVPTAWVRERIQEIENGKITVCLIKKAKPKIEGSRRPELDHIIPVALGGTTLGFENIQLLCNECHQHKTIKDMIEIRKARRKT